MHKRDIKYKDFNGEEQVDTCYFHLTKTELVEMESQYGEGMEDIIRQIVKTNDKKALIAEFKKMILLAYGQKSPDGKRFIKSDELRTEFSQTAAFDSLFIELATDDKAAAEFIQGVLPDDMPDVPLPPPNIQPVEAKVIEPPQS